jgi:hypothetical protein
LERIEKGNGLMVGIRFYVDNTKVGKPFTRNNKSIADRQRDAARKAAKDAASEIKEAGDKDISAAGNFGKRWNSAFHVDVTEGGGNIRIEPKVDIFYWRVFEYGAVIRGKPMLWIPLSFATDAKGVYARDYPGQLFRVNRAGKAPLLMTPGKPAQAKYFGKESVTIPKKFHLVQITRSIASRMRDLYLERFNNG